MQYTALTCFPKVLICFVLIAAGIGGAAATIEAGIFCAREVLALRDVADRGPVAAIAASPRFSRQGSHEDLAPTAFSARSFDDLVRFSAKIAHEQGVDVVRLQAEAVNTAPTRLSQARIHLQVRGDYAATKAFLISVLANFPGLTIERLTIHHNSMHGPAGSSTSSAPGPGDDSTIELIQYGMPRQVGA